MRGWKSVLGSALVLLAMQLGGCEVNVNKGDDEPTAGGGDELPNPCASLCATMAMVACAGDDADRCENDCNLTWDAGLCSEETHAALTCYAGQPAANWECDEFDEAAVKVGHCDAERTAFENCL